MECGLMQSDDQITGPAARKVEYVPLCVILERKDLDSPWADHIWQPVSVVLDAPQGVHGKIREEGDGWRHYFLECGPLELHRKDAPAYRDGLFHQGNASLWVILQDDEDPKSVLPYSVQLVTASPFEAQDYLDSGELIVEVVDMPEALQDFVQQYVDLCPEEEKFIKRKQNKKFHDDHRFGQQALHEIQALEKKRH